MIPIMAARCLRPAALAIGLAAGAAGAAPAAAPSTPEDFLRHLYAPYVSGDQTVSPTGKDAPTIFDAHLTALLRKDQANAKGEVGALDQDPICDCQDFDHLTALSITAKPRSRGRVIADVSFRNGAATTVLTYRLVETRSGWRVSDIGAKDIPSLARFLETAEAAH
jgi:hypothetical protein